MVWGHHHGHEFGLYSKDPKDMELLYGGHGDHHGDDHGHGHDSAHH
jgi:hypothetical protein